MTKGSGGNMVGVRGPSSPVCILSNSLLDSRLRPTGPRPRASPPSLHTGTPGDSRPWPLRAPSGSGPPLDRCWTATV